MPANLPAEAKSKWKRVMEARTPEEKLAALQEFLSAVPKHKGTERLRMQVTRQIAALRREIEERRKRRAGGGEQFFVEKEGDVQVVLIGSLGSGKTSLFRCLTGVSKPSQDRPVPGMVSWLGVYFQLVDTPGFLGFTDPGRLMALARNADALIVTLDSTANAEEQLAGMLRLLEENRISVKRPKAIVEIERRASGGVTVVGDLEGATVQDVVALLREYNVYHAVVRIQGRATLDDVEDAIFGSYVYRPTVAVLTKVDLVPNDHVKALRERLSNYGVPVYEFSAQRCRELRFDEIATYIFRELDLIRVYTRNPKTGNVEKRPVVVKRGAKVADVAKIIHSYLYENFRYAKVWRESFPFSPQRVGKDFVLEDGDIVEIVA